jgi:DNA-binding PadR family transcriptional regulator
MGIKEGILALLADGPRHGYLLKLDLELATGDAVAVNVGQVYTTLQRLERDGLVEDGGNDAEGRAVYRITQPGISSLRDWVSRPEDLAAAGRDEISIKVLLALFTPGLDPRQVIETQRRATMGLLQDFTQLRSQDNDADLAWQLHLDRLMYSAEAELKWLDRVEERLQRGEPPASTKKNRAESPAEEGVI